MAKWDFKFEYVERVDRGENWPDFELHQHTETVEGSHFQAALKKAKRANRDKRYRGYQRLDKPDQPFNAADAGAPMLSLPLNADDRQKLINIKEQIERKLRAAINPLDLATVGRSIDIHMRERIPFLTQRDGYERLQAMARIHTATVNTMTQDEIWLFGVVGYGRIFFIAADRLERIVKEYAE
jgi:hypothetical protein